jgi:rubrerythrin
MLKPGLIESLPDLPAPVLTVYLDTDRSKSVNRGLEPAYLISLKSRGKLLQEKLPPEDREPFEGQLARVEAYLRLHAPHAKGAVIFSGGNNWEFVPLEADIEDEVHWGIPDLAQLFWLLDEHKPYGIVLVSRKRAQFFLYRLRELLELEDKAFTLGPSKEKEMGPVARSGGVRVSRGTARDVFNHHVDAQYARYYRQIAEDIQRWSGAEHFQSMFLLGPAEMVNAIQKELSETMREKVISVGEDLGWVSRAELHKWIEPIVAKHEDERKAAIVNALLSEERGHLVGLDETLARLQQRRVRNLVVAKGLDATLKRCGECLWVDRTTDPVCPACGRERYTVTLRDVLPELARRYKVSVEVVSGEAGQELEGAGGIGAWLHEFERKEYGEHLTFA